MSQQNGKPTGAESIHWDLSDLYSSVDAPEIARDLEAISSRAATFSETYRGRVAGLTAQELLAAIREYESIKELMGRMVGYAYLNWSTDTRNTEFGRFTSQMERHQAKINQQLVFFMLEWMAAPESVAALTDAPALEPYRHYLHIQRLAAPYALSEKEEQVISQLSLTSNKGWQRYFGEVMSAARYELDGESLTQSEVLRHLYSPDRDLRQRAANALTVGLDNLSHTTTFIFNMLAQDKHSDDKLRGLPSWITARNLLNQADNETVETLINSVTSRYDIVARQYRLLRRLWGYETVYDYDRYAPILDNEWHVTWDEARHMVLNAFAAFDPSMAQIAEMFFERNWIDAALGPHKRGGAYSSRVSAGVHPYIFMNYTASPRSVMTLAHELGHGIHQYLSRQAGHLQQSTPLTTAEMASTFGEMLVFDALMTQIDDPKERLAMRVEKIGDTFATVFRQIAMNRFEDAMHTTFRQEGELTTERLSELWMETQRPMFGESVMLRNEYRLWWSYVPHFLNVPGYVYAYSFGELLVWALYARYQEIKSDFPALYMAALSKGGSVWPHELVAPMGIDLRDPGFWNMGLDLIEQMVAQAEEEASALAT